MRILLASDVHYRLPSLDWLCSVASDYDAVVLAGDLLDVANPVPIEAQIVVLDSYLSRLGALTRVFVSSGNHDLDGPGVHGEQVCHWLQRPRPGVTVHTDGETIDLRGNDPGQHIDAGLGDTHSAGSVRITLCPWWDGPITRGEVDAQLRAAAPVGLNGARLAQWIWVYHSPPAGTALCSDGRRTFPDHDLAGWIAELTPDLVFCGHIHQAPWAPDGSWFDRLGSTWVFNAGHLRARIPPHIVIDTSAGTAEWFGGLGEPSVRLDLVTSETSESSSAR